MDKAIIFGVFDFVSFHVCKTLLESGIEVTGISFKEGEEQFIEEKRLEVGRNANFRELSFSKWANDLEKESSRHTLLFSYYDLFMQFKEKLLENRKILASIPQYIKDYKDKLELITVLLPIQLMAGSSKTLEHAPFRAFLEQLNGLTDKIQIFYLPTIYGEWQPSTFLFQQQILTKINKGKDFIPSRESKEDAIYVQDAVQTLIGKMEAKEPGTYLLESGEAGQWERCMKFLGMEEEQEIRQEFFPSGNNLIRVTVKNNSSIFKSLGAQMEHIERIYLLK